MKMKMKTMDPEDSKERQLKQLLYKQQYHAERKKGSVEKHNQREEIVPSSTNLSKT